MKRCLSLLLALLLMLPLAACGTEQSGGASPSPGGVASSPPPSSPSPSADASSAQPSTQPDDASPAQTEDPSSGPADGEGDTITVIDMAGRVVEVEKNPQSVCFAWAGVGGFLLALGVQDRISAANGLNSFHRMVAPSLADVGTIGRGSPDMEALAALNPDVFFHRAAGVDVLEDVQALGITSIGIMAETQEDIIEALTLLGKVLGVEDRAAELIALYNNILERAKELTGSIPAGERSTAIVMGSELGRVAHAGMIQSVLIEAAGGINSAAADPDVDASSTAWTTVGVEKVFAWNPDFIFVTNSSSNEYTVADINADPAWANLNAVRNANVYDVPSTMDSWEFPGVSTCLGALWMVSVMYPDKLGRAEFESIVADFYMTVYGIEATPELLGY